MNPDKHSKEVEEKLRDRWWRLNNLYYIKDKFGRKTLFKPNDVQKYVYDNLWYFMIIPKARQLGMTTFFCILYLDQILFSANKTAVIIAHRQEDQKKIFRHKIKFAWDHLPSWVKNKIGAPNTDNANELTFGNDSSISVSTSARSGTVNFLHISEFGYTCQKFPDRAEEIVTGSINSVQGGDGGNIISIESTAHGREGYFYQFCMDADMNKKQRKELTEMDWKLFFFPWYVDREYRMDANFVIPKEEENYFSMLKDKHNILLTDSQKRWYIKKKEKMKDKMYQEYPSTLDECFQTATEGAYYASEMNRVYLSRRIRYVPYDPTLKVNTVWDLGINDDCVILFYQTRGAEIRFIDCYSSSGEGLGHYAKVLDDKAKANDWRYDYHVLPWDVETKDVGTGLTRLTTLNELGIRNIRVAPKLLIQDGIDRVRRLFWRFIFNEETTKALTDALANYRKDWDPKNGVFKNNPRHDSNSHWADCLRHLALVWTEEQILDEDSYDAENYRRQTEQSFFD